MALAKRFETRPEPSHRIPTGGCAVKRGAPLAGSTGAVFALDSGMQIHRLSDLRKEGAAYVEFLRTRNLSAGIYRLSAGAKDNQQPHAEEEIYYVLSGAARFRSGDSDLAVKPGDILFVPAKEPHRFHSIEQDLELLVFFAPPEGS
jgi:mannose-6-phosphate isomerase-like protein (cupin superfamily)